MTSTVNMIRKIRIVILAVVIAAAVFSIDTSASHAVSPWHEVTLTPGQTYDVSDAGWNTTVYINKAGNYTLKGESTKCRIVIQSGGVNVYLADGLVIDPGIKAYVGSRTAAVTVNDMDGTVQLISKPGADVYFGGYLTAPAVRKYGYNSKLVFETEDPANPGTITAYRAHQSSSAGIGSAYEFSGRVDTGNIEINSGNIIATGGYMSAGIGGGGNGNAYKITVNGGNVRAVGGSSGTGIGGGFHGNVSNIVINGGTVYAEGVEGAGIGSGEQSGYAKNVIINGGNVTAKADRGAGIGGGQRSEVENLKITGGTVYAYSRNTAIGSTCDQHLGNLNSLYITGGNITAESDHTAIGASGAAPGPNNIYISGGRINATADYYAIGGGGFSSVTDGDRITNVTISGGTIRAAGGEEDIGTNHTWMDEFNITITGGSLLAERAQMYSAPKNQFGDTVRRTNVTLDGISGSVKVTGASMTKPSSTYPDYGLNDVWTTNGILHFWIPDETEVSRVDTAESTYRGTAVSGQNGTLYPDTSVELLSDDSALTHGTGTVYKGSDKINIISVPEISKGHVAAGYLINGTDVMIADAKGNLKKNVSVGGEIYTDADGKWTRGYEAGVTFKAAAEPAEYIIKFDANIPENTSGTPSPDGDMDPITVDYTEELVIPSPDYTLTGYEFREWNTKADGTGTSYKAGSKVSKMTTDGTVTLYAQWIPRGYSVKFEPNGGSGTMAEQSMVYDVPEALDANQFTAPEGMRFAGWMRSGVLGGTLRTDKAVVCNLCDHSEDGTVTGYILKAQWVQKDVPTVAVTIDGKRYNGLKIELEKDTDRIELQESQGAPGLYSASPEIAVAPGVYDILVNGNDTGIEMSVGNADADNYADLEYFTVSVYADEHLTDAAVSQSEVLKGAKVEISVRETAGYKFEKWTAIECDPESADLNKAATTVVIKEKTVLKAVSRPVNYSVSFDSNKPAPASGEMKGTMGNQSFTYDKRQKLTANAYVLEGHTFTGWEDESGRIYADKEEVINLASEEGTEVKLYAQWDPNTYTIQLNGYDSDGEKTASVECTYDSETEMPGCSFIKSGYHFIGWNTEIDGTGTYYYPGDKVKNLTSEQGGTVVLYAVWEHDGYIVKYDANGGEGQSAEIYVWTGEAYILSNPGFSREGYLMTGWNTAPDGTGKAYDADEKVKDLANTGETVILYAQWEECLHSGGTATCASQAVCEKCGLLYGDADPSKHDGGTEVRNAEPAEEFKDGYTGDIYCLGCDALIEKGEVIPATHAPADPSEPTDPPDNAKTGDDMSLMLYVILALAGIAAAAAAAAIRRKA